MKKILLIYPPFCTPVTPSYSITNLYSLLKSNNINSVEVLDLNLEFHKIKFSRFKQSFQNKFLWEDSVSFEKNYEDITKEYNQLTSKCYSTNNKSVVNNGKPELLDLFIDKIKNIQPDIIAFSLVYSSQCFYTYALLKELKEYNTIIGGPAVNEKLISLATKKLNNETEFLNYISNNSLQNPILDYPLDFGIHKLNEYFTPIPVIPIKTCNSCYYKGCSYCSHHKNLNYEEYSLDLVKQTIIISKQKYFFLIDDMISLKRLLEFAKIVKPLKIKWCCQLKPTKDFNYLHLKKLKDAGLDMIMWGVESANTRILKLINKGTNPKEIEQVLRDSNKAGIKNITYILFGFPTETKEEFLETIDFLKQNKQTIDLISASVFGLQHNTPIYRNPSKFGITKVIEEKRTILEPKISYELESGLSNKQITKLRDNYKKTILNINKYPHTMNFFREHMLIILTENSKPR